MDTITEKDLDILPEDYRVIALKNFKQEKDNKHFFTVLNIYGIVYFCDNEFSEKKREDIVLEYIRKTIISTDNQKLLSAQAGKENPKAVIFNFKYIVMRIKDGVQIFSSLKKIQLLPFIESIIYSANCKCLNHITFKS